MKETHCPACQAPLNMSAAGIDANPLDLGERRGFLVDLAITPGPGDVGVCANCGAIHVYVLDRTAMREDPNTEELNIRPALPADDIPVEAYRAQREIEAYNRRKRESFS